MRDEIEMKYEQSDEDEFSLDVRVMYGQSVSAVKGCTDASCPCYTLPCTSSDIAC